MSKKYHWLKISGSLVIVVLFFLILNSFFRENNQLLEERKIWEEKAKTLEDSLKMVQSEKQELERIIDQCQPGLIITTFDVATLAFTSTANNRLAYHLLLTIENRANKAIPESSGELLLAFHLPGANTPQRTTWRRIWLPSFQPGEVKTMPLTGEIAASPGEEILFIVNINHQPGVAKVLVRLMDESEQDAPLQP